MFSLQHKTEYFPFSELRERSKEKEKIKEVIEFFNILFNEGRSDRFTKYNITSLLNSDVFNTSDNSYFYTEAQLIKEVPFLVGGTNLYFTYNGFKRNSRKAEALNKINCIAFDIDFKEQELNHLEIIDILINDISIKPTYIVNSGNGLHLYYKIESYKNTFDYTEKYYNRVYKEFSEYLKKYNILVDRQAYKPINRVLRVPYTLNYKPNCDAPQKHPIL